MEAAVEPVPQAPPVDASDAPQPAVAEPMTDAEAEAVLLALREPRLRWEVRDGRHKVRLDDRCLYASQKTTEASSYGMQWYEIWQGTQERPFVARQEMEIGPSIIGAECKTLDAAKLACERHHATGRWE